MSRAPHPDDPAGSNGAVTPHVRHARLRARIKALLGSRLKRRARPSAPEDTNRPSSSWPDSFFDLPPGS